MSGRRLPDMDPDGIVGDAVEHVLHYFDGSSRRIFVTDIETPFPEGELIVSRTDVEGVITDVNPAFVHMSGYSANELLGAPHHILRHPDMPAPAFADLWSTVLNGEKWRGYVKNLRADGGYYWVFATAIPNFRNGKLVGITSVRRKPSRTRVNECIALYASMQSGMPVPAPATAATTGAIA
ncbi:MAG: PAS domain-containing protein [Acidimicrobiia bacterium]